jgi:SAM-dependent methyltransferase
MEGRSRVRIEPHIEKEFLSIQLRPRNITFYSPRSTILASVKTETASFHGKVLDVGCGFMPYRHLVESVPAVERYVGMDLEQSSIYTSVKPDLTWDGAMIPTEDESFDCVMATEFLEHYTEPEKVLSEIHRVMKPNGIFFATVPFIWNLHEVPHDEYRFTPYSLERHLRYAGFENIQIKPLGGWNMAFAQMIGLWLGFSPINRFLRPVLKVLLYPFYFFLVKTDKKFDGFDGAERSMFSGLVIRASR